MANKNANEQGQLSFFPDKQSSNENVESQSEFIHDEYYEEEKTEQDSVISNPSPDSYTITYIDDEETLTDAEVAPEHTVKPQRVSTTGIIKGKKVKKERIRGFFRFDYRKSFILNFILTISNAIGKAFRNSSTVSVFTSFDTTREVFSDSFTSKTLTSQKSEKISTEFKKNFRKNVSDATIPSLFSGFFSSLAHIKTRIYGYLLFAFGIITLLCHFFVADKFDFFNENPYNPITAVIVMISAVFLIACNKTISEAVRESAILSTLLFNFLGIKRPIVTDDDAISIPASGAGVVGLILGVITLFFPAHSILAVIFTIIYTFIVVKFPETGCISLILILPFMYNSALLYISAVITISYIFKMLTGKRTASFEFSDAFIVFFLILMLLSETVTFGNSSNTFMYTAFILVYFICVSALKERVWFERAINSFVLVAGIYTAYSLFVTLLGRTLGLDIEFTANTDLGDPTKSVISSSSVLSLFVMCGIIFIFASFIDSKSKSKKFVCTILIIVSLVYLFLEASLSVIASLIIAMIVYLVLISSKTVILLVAAAVIIPLLPLFFSGVYTGVADILENEAYRTDIYSAVVNMLSTYGFSGIGMADNAFSELYATYYVGNTVTAPHAHSFFFQLAISLGIPGLVLFLVILFFIFQGAFSYGRNTTDKWSKNRMYCYAGMCSVLALMLCGITEHIAYNPRIFLLFWLMCGLTVCARRSSKDISGASKLMTEYDEIYNG